MSTPKGYSISIAEASLPGIHSAAPMKPKKTYCYRKYLLIGGGGLAVLGLLLILVIVMLLTVKDEVEEFVPWHSEEMCPNVTKCSKSGYSKPPLLLISIDGFRRDYLDQPGWVTWLKKMAECGVTAEKVFPVYPSSTFPNHYTQVTGLYPVHHGIVDNAFWDREKDKWPVHLSNFTVEHFKGVPIWKHYMATGGRANCFFWPGSDQRYCSEYMPYNQTIPIADRVAKVREWLNLPEERRPGLLAMYFHHLDSAGHQNTLPNILDNIEVEASVKQMDQVLHDFFQSLADDGILNCVNIVVTSDHGMITMSEAAKVEKVEDYVFFGSPVSKIYRNQTEKEGDLEISKAYALLSEMGIIPPTDDQNRTAVCHQNNKRLLISTDASRPTRFHYSGSRINGDLIVEGRPGLVFSENPNSRKGSIHGYDYLYKEMQTVFFARGPSFRPGTLLPPFQQIEYFNLFLDLLGLGNIQNNGTVGIFDPALSDPPKRPEEKNGEIRTCSTVPNVNFCCSSLPACPQEMGLQLFHSNLKYCTQSDLSLCGKTVYKLEDNVVALVEALIPEKKSSGCSMRLDSRPCSSSNNFLSLSADPEIKISSLILSGSGDFIATIVSALDNFQNELQKTSKVYVLSGTTVDKDRDGIADDDQSPPATHFYRLYVYCKDNKYAGSGEETVCSNKDQLATLGFIFPLIQEDPNCLEGKDLLLYYSARLKDVELISGLRLMLVGYSTHERAVLRTRIVEQL